MSTTRADKKADAPPKSGAKPTTYEISAWREGTRKPVTSDPNTAAMSSSGSPPRGPSWEPVATIETTGGAHNAIRRWCEQQGDKFAGGRLRATPVSNITELLVKVETKRQLTLGTP